MTTNDAVHESTAEAAPQQSADTMHRGFPLSGGRRTRDADRQSVVRNAPSATLLRGSRHARPLRVLTALEHPAPKTNAGTRQAAHTVWKDDSMHIALLQERATRCATLPIVAMCGETRWPECLDDPSLEARGSRREDSADGVNRLLIGACGFSREGGWTLARGFCRETFGEKAPTAVCSLPVARLGPWSA